MGAMPPESPISRNCYLTFPKQALVFTCLQHKSFENTVGKGEIARNKQFLLFPQCFLPVWRTFCHFHQIWNCHLQTLSVWKSLKFVVWERVKPVAGISDPDYCNFKMVSSWPPCIQFKEKRDVCKTCMPP